MSRCAQYIGLNKYAEDWLKSALRVEEYQMTTGMFDEPVMGRIYHMPLPEGPNIKGYIAKEVVQCVPWSGGPMIFSHIHMTLVREEGPEEDMGDGWFSWMFDPSINGECDHNTGRYKV